MVPVRDLAGFSTGVQGLGLGGMGFRLGVAVSGFGLSGLSGFRVSGLRGFRDSGLGDKAGLCPAAAWGFGGPQYLEMGSMG